MGRKNRRKMMSRASEKRSLCFGGGRDLSRSCDENTRQAEKHAEKEDTHEKRAGRCIEGRVGENKRRWVQFTQRS